MKIKIAQICIILFICFNAHSQTWQWARTEPGTGAAEGFAVCSDPAGNVFLAGSINGSFVIGTYTVSNTPGISIAFLVKYDPNGNILWLRSFPSTSIGTGVYTDNAGNVFMCGWFTGILTIGTNSITSAGGLDAFLIKYDPNGNVLWLRRVGGSANDDRAYSVSTDALGNSLITGYFNSPSMTVGNFTLINTSVVQYFLVKYDPNGNVLWAVTQQSGPGSAFSVCTDANNNVFITGFHSWAITIGQYTLPTAGVNDFFVAKYDPSGTVQWAATGGGSQYNISNCVNADPSGNVYITGLYDSPTLTVGNYTLTNAGSFDVFIVKYDNNGNILWAKREGGTGKDEGLSLASYSGGVFLAGSVGLSPSVVGAFAGFTIGNNFINPTPLVIIVPPSMSPVCSWQGMMPPEIRYTVRHSVAQATTRWGSVSTNFVTSTWAPIYGIHP